MSWNWDENKNRSNKRKHGLSFESAQYVFTDPLALTRSDTFPDEERYQTIGLVGSQIILVVHTWPEINQILGQEVGRIISARKATTYEKRAYEQGTF